MDRKYELLSKYFGYRQFRTGQEELIDAILSGRDSFGIMPTGGGKSICYQLPALMMKGITLVISPLISLMKDQVLALKNAGISAAYINSSLTIDQLRKVYGYMSQGRYKIIYVAPERLFTEGFQSSVKRIDVAMVAVDEAHCISQWGQDFRPTYLRIPDFIDSLEKRPVVSAFTATATGEVQQDIVRLLKLRSPFLTVTGFDRPNLYFDVLRPGNKTEKLISLLEERRGKTGIVYCSTRKEVEKVTQELCDAGFFATRYHAGLSDEERKFNQDDFIFDRKNIIVATNAFGMGIDKSNVSFVIHYNMPKSPEAYYQEAGRAGRDGAAAECILLFAAKDVATAKFLIENSSENEELSAEERAAVIEGDNRRLDRMVTYSNTSSCLRAYMLRYFGQQAEAFCGNCGNCKNESETVDITEQACKIISCVQRVKNFLGYTPGETLLINVLRGSKEQRVIDLRLDTVRSYGIMKESSKNEVKAVFDRLLFDGYLRKNEFDGIVFSAKSESVLFDGEKVFMTVRKTRDSSASKKSGKAGITVGDADLYDILRAVRMRIARAEKVPAYIIFSNATLQDMAEKAPVSMEAFMDVTGVGKVKAELYGEIFTGEIKKYLNRK